MGFWGGLKKVAQGKPVFETPNGQEQPEGPTGPLAEGGTSLVDSAGRKVIPEVKIEHCKSRISGSEMEVTAWVTNPSGLEIELEKIVLLGMTTDLDYILSPGKSRELQFYKGNTPKEDSYHTANLYYTQRVNDDYFQADFEVEYDYDSQGFYKVEALHPIQPVRDI